MRVIAGAARGRPLRTAAGRDTRPTADRVKEALFSSLQPLLPGAAVLDAFAGSGALGLEALSRGAATVTFVEHDRRALAALRRNLEVVALPGGRVVATDVARALAGTPPGAPFDLALLDPPYRLPDARLTVLLRALAVHLRPGAEVVVERAARDGAVAWPAEMLDAGSRRYGDTAVHRARAGGP